MFSQTNFGQMKYCQNIGISIQFNYNQLGYFDVDHNLNHMDPLDRYNSLMSLSLQRTTKIFFFWWLDTTWFGMLTDWGRVTKHYWFWHKFTPCGHQAILWTNAGISFIGPLGTNFRECWIKKHTFSFIKIRFKKRRLQNSVFFVSASMRYT